MSLESAIEWYLLKFFPKDFPYHINVDLAEKLPSKLKVEIYRIIQEAIANVKKHAFKSSTLEIEIYESSNKVYIKVSNELPIEKKYSNFTMGRGLRNIELRAQSFGGEFSIKKSEGIFEIKVSFKIQDIKED